jgi:hypothetical protein
MGLFANPTNKLTDPLKDVRGAGRNISDQSKKGGRNVARRFQKATGRTGKREKEAQAKHEREERKKAREDKAKDIEDRLGRLFGRDSKSSKEVRAAISGIKGTDTSAEQARLRAMGLSPGDTAVASRLLGKQEAEEGIRREQAERQAAVQGASAFSQLAQTGGAGGGSRERLLGQTGSQALRQQQQLRREGALARLGIQSQDEIRKEEALRRASGLSVEDQKSRAVAASQRAGLLGGQQKFETAGQATALGFGAGAFGAEQLSGSQFASADQGGLDPMKPWGSIGQMGQQTLAG